MTMDPRQHLATSSFLNWNPPNLYPAPIESDLPQSRVYRFYDQHLAEAYVCKNVVHAKTYIGLLPM